jgi:hypothetical protein
MTVTVALDRDALLRRIEALSLEIQTTRDTLAKLDLIQQRCEVRELLVGVETGDLAAAN